jgi:hypothetical protein
LKVADKFGQNCSSEIARQKGEEVADKVQVQGSFILKKSIADKVIG